VSRRDTLPGHRWVCHYCTFTCETITEALNHPETHPNWSHWVYEHPNGDVKRNPTRELHSSDAGGCYVARLIDGKHVPPAGPTVEEWLEHVKA